MPRKNSSGFTQSWTRLNTEPGLGAFSAIAPAAANAARNWMDNLQTSAPGYRDRVVHVYLDDHEDGLNLNMPADVQAALADYGTEAANRIIGHFINGRDYEGLAVAQAVSCLSPLLNFTIRLPLQPGVFR